MHIFWLLYYLYFLKVEGMSRIANMLKNLWLFVSSFDISLVFFKTIAYFFASFSYITTTAFFTINFIHGIIFLCFYWTQRYSTDSNYLNEHIQFTYEKETHSSLPYLDLLINHKDDGSLWFSVYRKPTNTGKHLDFFSFHPLSQKRSVSSSLYKRAKDLCSEDTLQDEYKIGGQIYRVF